MQKILRKAETQLRARDPVLARLIDLHGPCSLFDGNSLVHKSHFHVLVWAIINQQLSVKAALSIEHKLLSLIKKNEFKITSIKNLSDTKLAGCGLSRQKIRYLRALCEAINSKQLQLNRLAQDDNVTVYNKLTRLPGIGPWTVDMFLMFSLGRLDVLPLGDLALRKSLIMHYELPEQAQVEDYYKIAENWQPYQSIASWYLWAAVD